MVATASKNLNLNLKLFQQIKNEISLLDPVSFAENHLTVDGKPFRMSGTGWKFMADLYREVATQASNKNAKPMVILKGRQIGATVLAAVLSLYFTSSGLYGTGPDKPPMRALHVFPTLGLMSKYAKDKLGPMVAGSQNGYINSRMLKNDVNAIKVAGTEDAIAEKTFKGYNKLRIDGTGVDGDRIRGLSQDVVFFDECFPYNQTVEIEGGKKKRIGDLYKMYVAGETMPLVKSFNESTGGFEYKTISGAWYRGRRRLIRITCGHREIRCTHNHRFLTERGWVEASQLACGDLLKMSPGTDLMGHSVQTYCWNQSFKPYTLTCVDAVSDDGDDADVYDIGVEDNHNFVICPGRTSKNVGGPIVHNCQDMSREAIETAGPILTSAQYGAPTKGIQVYFGTPKGTGSYFYGIWQKSDQRFYQLRCVGCAHYFFLYTIGSDSWKKIWISGHDIKCPECGNIQKKAEAIEGGRWMPTKTGDTQYVGYHVSVLLHPWFTKESILDLDPSINRERSERAWKNETLGEFYSGGGMTVSFDDIRANCCDSTRNLAKSILDRGDKTIVMGIDWGGKDLVGSGVDDDGVAGKPDSGQSYTAVVIMSIDKSGVFTIENAFRLKRNDFEYKVNIISEMYRLFKVQVAAADIGYGQDIVQHMQGAMGFGERFLGCINSGTLNSTISYKPKELRVVLNKDAMIEEIFSMVRNGKIKFPVHGESYDRIEWLMQHFTSMEVKKIVKNDNVYNRYVKGSIQNDGLMAAIYGLIAYKFLATSGFKGSEAKAKGPGLPAPMLAYLPKI